MMEVLFGFVERAFMFIWKIIRVLLIIFIVAGIAMVCEGDWTGILVAIFFFLLLGVGEVTMYGYRNKCPHCKKWFSLKKTATLKVGEKNISMPTEVKHRNAYGEVTGTSEQYIPGTRRTFCETYLCKECGEKSYRSYTRDSKNV